MEKKRFEGLVAEAIDSLPGEFLQKLENVDIEVEDEPSQELLDKQGLRYGTLLGLYQGVPQNRRGRGYSLVLPDRITIFRWPIEKLCRNEAKIKRRVREVVIHEIGHHFGMSEAQIRRALRG